MNEQTLFLLHWVQRLDQIQAMESNDVLHILKELEYILPITPHLEAYYFIWCLQTCILVGYAPQMFNTHIMVDDFKCMWKI
jgi:hypothetical protein